MNTAPYSTDDSDIERLFAEAKKYPLLSAEQEQDIDGQKWDAVAELQSLFAQSLQARSFLAELAEHCLHHPPDVARFVNREHYFLLRRELGDYLAGCKGHAAMAELHQQLLEKPSAGSLELHLGQLNLPASLVVGITQLLMADDDSGGLCGVAIALQQWSANWRNGHETCEQRLEREFLPAAASQLRRYADARDQLILHNQRLVYKIAGRNAGKGVTFLDLVQEGSMGLLRAAEKFESRKGFRFSTYCFNWITQAIRRALGDTGALIRYPGHVQDQLGKLYRESANTLSRTGTKPLDSELANTLGLSVEKTRSLLQLRNMGVSLDKPRFEDDDDGSLLDTMPADTFAHPSSTAETASLQRCLLNEIDQLDPAERHVVISRWGLNQGRPLTRGEIADQMAVSREWVRQLERSALAKLGENPVVHSAYIEHNEVSRN